MKNARPLRMKYMIDSEWKLLKANFEGKYYHII